MDSCAPRSPSTPPSSKPPASSRTEPRAFNDANGRDSNPGHGSVDWPRESTSQTPPGLLRQLLPELLQPLGTRVAGIDIAVAVDADAFQGAEVFGFLDEPGDLAVLGVADPDALLEARVGLVGRLRVGDIDLVVLVDPYAAGPAELLPLGEEVAVLVKDLKAVVGAIGHEQTSGGVEREAVGYVEFAGPRTFLPPRLDELAVTRELDDAGVGLVAMSVGDEDIAVRRYDHIGGRVEMGGVLAGLARCAESHQHLAVGRKLHNGMACLLVLVSAPVGDPDVVVLIDEQAMGDVGHSGREARHHVSGGIVLVERRDLGALAAGGAAAVIDPHALAVAVDIEPDGGTVPAPHGLLGPAFLEAVRVGGGVGILGIRRHGRHDDRRNGDPAQQFHAIRFTHDSPPC